MPKTVRVGPHTYTILRQHPRMTKAENGICLPDTLQVSVKKGLRRSKAREILLHELLHAISYPTLMAEGRNYTDEEFIEYFALHLLAMLRDNPDLVAFLLESDSGKNE